MEMAQYILKILRAQAVIVFSWGAHDFHAIRNGLCFSVEGFIFKGIVKIVYNEGADTFTVYLVNEDNSIHSEHTDVYFDELVGVIDLLVEKCENYKERVEAEYSFQGSHIIKV